MQRQTSASAGDDEVSASIAGDINSLVARASALQHSVDSWNGWYVITLALAALIALAVFFTNRQVIAHQRSLVAIQAEILRSKDDQLAKNLKQKDVEIASANERASSATEKAAAANERATVLEQHAADAKATQQRVEVALSEQKERTAAAELSVEKERLARLRLIDLLRHRSLNATPTSRERLKKFAGVPWRLEVAPNESEASGLGSDIQFWLQDAGWTFKGVFKSTALPFDGVEIVCKVARGPHNEPLIDAREYVAATQLAEYLRANGLMESSGVRHLSSELDPGIVLVRIGRHPDIAQMIASDRPADEILQKTLQERSLAVKRKWFPAGERVTHVRIAPQALNRIRPHHPSRNSARRT
jgi:hypothetical protein